MRVYLYKNKKRKTCQVHRLVAEAFTENPNNLPEVNHKKEDPTRNYAIDLEWCNHKYNCNYGNRNNKIGKPILQYDTQGNFIKEWNTIKEASRKLNIEETNISRCCKKEKYRKTAGGYIWRYKDAN
jgi:hypothetical protein